MGSPADWFAVSALSRGPPGLFLPHPNILAKSKDAIAEEVPRSLTGFVTNERIGAALESGGLREESHSMESLEMATVLNCLDMGCKPGKIQTEDDWIHGDAKRRQSSRKSRMECKRESEGRRVMKRVEAIEYKGHKIVKVDFSDTRSEEENLGIMEEAKKLIHSQPPQSVLTCTCLANVFLTPKSVNDFVEYVASNKNHVQLGAIYGATEPTVEFMTRTVKKGSERLNLKVFGSLEEALDFLVS